MIIIEWHCTRPFCRQRSVPQLWKLAECPVRVRPRNTNETLRGRCGPLHARVVKWAAQKSNNTFRRRAETTGHDSVDSQANGPRLPSRRAGSPQKMMPFSAALFRLRASSDREARNRRGDSAGISASVSLSSAERRRRFSRTQETLDDLCVKGFSVHW